MHSNSLKGLKEKIRSLETERSSLKMELENLRKVAEGRAAALEGDVASMREELRDLRAFLGSDAAVPPSVGEDGEQVNQVESDAAPELDDSGDNSVSSIDVSTSKDDASEAETPNDEPSVTVASEDESPKDDASGDDASDTSSTNSVLGTLNGDERKVVEVLLAHEGKYQQKLIRSEAKLSWLQANRIISRLVERGVVSFEKTGSTENVVLAKS